MDVDQRRFLKATACLALSGLVDPLYAGIPAEADQIPGVHSWHPVTRSLIRRAQEANSADKRANTSQVDRIIRETAVAQGSTTSPVIKWLADPSSAFDYLSRYGLDELLQMGSAGLWRRAGPSPPLTRLRRLLKSQRPAHLYHQYRTQDLDCRRFPAGRPDARGAHEP
jgi:hypothetical protein